MKKLYFLLSMLITSIAVQAQNDLEHKAPTLQIGLDGMSFSKGTLDAQLIMEIIAEKQNELKIKAVQNVFLSKVKNSGGTVYAFTSNVVKELVMEKDEAVRTKKILENTVNLVFTTVYLEYYLRKLDGTRREMFLDLAQEMGYSRDSLAKSNTITLSSLITAKFKNPKDSRMYQDKRALDFMALLIDMASEAVRQDKKLKQLGLMQISYSATYEYMNKYKNKSCPFEDTEKCTRYYHKVDSVYSDMISELIKTTDNIGLVNYIVEHFSFRNDKLAVFGQTALDEKTLMPYKASLPQLKDSIRELIREIISNDSMTSKKKDEVNNLTNIYFYIDKAIKQNSNLNKSSIGSDVLYTFYSEFIPILKRQSYGSTKYLDIISDLDATCASLAKMILAENKMKIEDGTINDFFLLASKLYEFNRAATISEYLKLVEDIGYLFPDENIKNALSTIVSFIKDYTATGTNEQGKEVINFNVESFIVKLQNIKPYKHSRWQFHFTVGLNNAYFNKDLPMNDGSVVRNLSFVSEKIGVKYKIKDWGFYYPRNIGETYLIRGKNPFKRTTYTKIAAPKEPMINNWHFLAYGSGLLYNVVNAKTNNEFNMPMIGVGTGLTFSNALDFNLCWGIPIFAEKSFAFSKNYSFVTLGFDIQFVEYYERLSAKRNANKTQKRLANAIH